MKKAEYPDCEKQKIQHGFFVKKLQKISEKDIEDSQHEVLLKLMNFLSNWITGHILEEDMKYVPYLKNKT
jgi:hemerythrin